MLVPWIQLFAKSKILDLLNLLEYFDFLIILNIF